MALQIEQEKGNERDERKLSLRPQLPKFDVVFVDPSSKSPKMLDMEDRIGIPLEQYYQRRLNEGAKRNRIGDELGLLTGTKDKWAKVFAPHYYDVYERSGIVSRYSSIEEQRAFVNKLFGQGFTPAECSVLLGYGPKHARKLFKDLDISYPPRGEITSRYWLQPEYRNSHTRNLGRRSSKHPSHPRRERGSRPHYSIVKKELAKKRKEAFNLSLETIGYGSPKDIFIRLRKHYTRDKIATLTGEKTSFIRDMVHEFGIQRVGKKGSDRSSKEERLQRKRTRVRKKGIHVELVGKHMLQHVPDSIIAKLENNGYQVIGNVDRDLKAGKLRVMLTKIELQRLEQGLKAFTRGGIGEDYEKAFPHLPSKQRK